MQDSNLDQQYKALGLIWLGTGGGCDAWASPGAANEKPYFMVTGDEVNRPEFDGEIVTIGFYNAEGDFISHGPQFEGGYLTFSNSADAIAWIEAMFPHLATVQA